jgi:hypothetical protein
MTNSGILFAASGETNSGVLILVTLFKYAAVAALRGAGAPCIVGAFANTTLPQSITREGTSFELI